MPLLRVVTKAIRRHRLLSPGDGVVAGVSGGADSLCLLHLLDRLRDKLGFSLHVVHLNHRLRGVAADQDAAFVAQTARACRLPVTVGLADVSGAASEAGIGIEEAARQLRYRFLVEVAARVSASVIAVGHNAGDQAETVLMQLLRGTGLAGLRGMQPRQDWGSLGIDVDIRLDPVANGMTVIRPLLEVSRQEIEAYCQHHGLSPRTDLTNLDPAFFRNRVRLEALPFLEDISPGFSGRLNQLAQIAAGDYDLVQALVDEHWSRVVTKETPDAISLNAAAWRILPLGLRRGLLRFAVSRMRPLGEIGFRQIEEARRVADRGNTSAEASLPGGLRLLVCYDTLFVGDRHHFPEPPAEWPMLSLDHSGPYPIIVPGKTALPGSHWVVEARLLPAEPGMMEGIRGNRDRCHAFLDADVAGRSLTIRRRETGERFQPLGMDGSTLLSDFMINLRIPAPWRGRIPVLARAESPTAAIGLGDKSPGDEPGQLLWVGGWRLDRRARVTGRTQCILHVSLASNP